MMRRTMTVDAECVIARIDDDDVGIDGEKGRIELVR